MVVDTKFDPFIGPIEEFQNYYQEHCCYGELSDSASMLPNLAVQCPY